MMVRGKGARRFTKGEKTFINLLRLDLFFFISPGVLQSLITQ